MNLDQLQVLETIKETGSFSKASEKLGRAKSAVSYAISNLEDELGLLLIDRSKYRVEITKYGEQLLLKAAPILRSFQELKEQAKLLSKNQELTLALSVSGLWPIEKVTPVLRLLEQNYPQTEIIFTREILSGEKMLLNKEVDLAILSLLENRYHIDYKEIGSVKMPLVVSVNHPLAAIDNPSKEDFAKYPQIIVRSTIQDDGRNFGVLDKAKKWHVDAMESKLQLILEGLGWGRLPENIVDELIQRQCLKVITSPDLKEDVATIYLARRKYEYHGTVSQYIWENI